MKRSPTHPNMHDWLEHVHNTQQNSLCSALDRFTSTHILDTLHAVFHCYAGERCRVSSCQRTSIADGAQRQGGNVRKVYRTANIAATRTTATISAVRYIEFNAALRPSELSEAHTPTLSNATFEQEAVKALIQQEPCPILLQIHH